jgi:hypothetical protein
VGDHRKLAESASQNIKALQMLVYPKQKELRNHVEATVHSDESVTVIAGSLCRYKTGNKDRKELERGALMKRGILRVSADPKYLEFSQDYKFETPSAAADIVNGGNASGREYWIDKKTGKSLAELRPAK